MVVQGAGVDALGMAVWNRRPATRHIFRLPIIRSVRGSLPALFPNEQLSGKESHDRS